jgi:hypothetical protein
MKVSFSRLLLRQGQGAKGLSGPLHFFTVSIAVSSSSLRQHNEDGLLSLLCACTKTIGAAASKNRRRKERISNAKYTTKTK